MSWLTTRILGHDPHYDRVERLMLWMNHWPAATMNRSAEASN
jgi:hypothetical protein